VCVCVCVCVCVRRTVRRRLFMGADVCSLCFFRVCLTRRVHR
jgi:hypothetical protein